MLRVANRVECTCQRYLISKSLRNRGLARKYDSWQVATRSLSITPQKGEESGKRPPISKNGIAHNVALQATKVGAAANLLLFLSKGITGYAINSTAMLADAFGSLGDLCTDAIVYYSVEQARKAASPDRPWGRGKMEPIGAFVVSGILGMTGVGIGYTALGKVWQLLLASPEFVNNVPRAVAPILGVPESITAVEPLLAASSELVIGALAVSAASMVVKEVLFKYTVNAGLAANSAAVVANAWQHRSDVMVSGAVFMGIAGSHFGYPILDPAVAVIVAGIITKQAGNMGLKSLKDLSDAPASTQETDALKATVAAIKGIEHVKDLKARQSGPFLFVECTICINGHLSASTAHRLAELVKRRLLVVHAGRVSNAVVHVVPLGSAGLGEKTGENNRSHIFIRKEIARILLPHSVTAHHEPRQNIVGSEHMQLQQLEQIGSASATASNADASSSVHPGTGITIEEIATDLAPTPTTKEEEEDEEKRLLKHITSVEEVQVYYRDDGRVSLKVDVAMNHNITIRDAHKVAVTAAKMIHTNIEGVADVDVDLELDEGAYGGSSSGSGSGSNSHTHTHINVKGRVKKDD